MLVSLLFLMCTSLLLGGIALLLFTLAIKKGWFEDIEGPKYRMLEDDKDEVPMIPDTDIDLNKDSYKSSSTDKVNSSNNSHSDL